MIDDITPLTNLTNLIHLNLSDNSIYDITPLSNLTNLGSLILSQNEINNIAPLVSNPGLGDGDYISLDNDILDPAEDCDAIKTLISRGVEVNNDLNCP